MERQDQLLDEKIQTLAELVRSISADEDVDPLACTQTLWMISQTARSALRQAVPEARHDGASWARIGKALNMSKQAAWEQYGWPER